MFTTLRKSLTQAALIFFLYLLLAEIRRTKALLATAEGDLAYHRIDRGRQADFRRAVANEFNLSAEATAKLTPERAAEMIAKQRIDNDRLRETVRHQRQLMAEQQRVARKRNVDLDALHYVWCAGGCEDGVHRYDGKGAEAITPEIVDAAIRNTERLVTWSRARVWRGQWMKLTPDLQTEFSRLQRENAELRDRLATAERERDAFRAAVVPPSMLVTSTQGTAQGTAQGTTHDDMVMVGLCPHVAEVKALEESLADLTLRHEAASRQVGRFADLAHTLACRATVAVMLFLRRADGRLLLARQPDEETLSPGLWSFPLGVVQVEDRGLGQTARRLAITAAKLHITDVELLAVNNYTPLPDEGLGVVTVYMAARVNEARHTAENGEVDPFLRANEGTETARWVANIADLPPSATTSPFTTDLGAFIAHPWTAHETLLSSEAMARHLGTVRVPVDLARVREMAVALGTETEAGKAMLRLAVEVERLRAALERDRTGLGQALQRVQNLARAWTWTAADLTSVGADDARWREALGHVMPEISEVAIRALRASGNLVTQAFHGEPLTPTAPMSIEQALAALLVHRGRLEALIAEVWDRVEEPDASGPGWATPPTIVAWQALPAGSRDHLLAMVRQVLRVALGMTGEGAQLELFAPPRERPEDVAARLITFEDESLDDATYDLSGTLSVAGIALLTTDVKTGETLRDALRAALAEGLTAPPGNGKAEGGEPAEGPPGAAAEGFAHRTMGLWRYHGIEGGKYLVRRRDGTRPGWPYFVLGAKDPAAAAGLLAYAAEAERKGFDAQYVADLRRLAEEFETYRRAHGPGDPDAPPARPDDPATVAEMVATPGDNGEI